MRTGEHIPLGTAAVNLPVPDSYRLLLVSCALRIVTSCSMGHLYGPQESSFSSSGVLPVCKLHIITE
jgi:hypothetical protein